MDVAGEKEKFTMGAHFFRTLIEVKGDDNIHSSKKVGWVRINVSENG